MLGGGGVNERNENLTVARHHPCRGAETEAAGGEELLVRRRRRRLGRECPATLRRETASSEQRPSEHRKRGELHRWEKKIWREGTGIFARARAKQINTEICELGIFAH